MILAGIAAALAAAVMNAWAVVLQAIEAHAQPEGSAMRGALLLRLARRPRWLAGTALMIAAGGCQLAALALAPISVVQPMLASSQLVLLAIARARLREHVGVRELLAVGAIAAGVVAVVLVAPGRVTRQVSAGALVAPLASIGGAALVVYLLGRAHPRARLGLVIGAGLAYSWADCSPTRSLKPTGSPPSAGGRRCCASARSRSWRRRPPCSVARPSAWRP
jgi:hypothetical protein